VKILLTGANGQLGTELLAVTEVAGDEVVACGHADLDVADREAVLQAIQMVAPDVVLHAAAWTNVDGCETDPARAYAVNALGTRNIAEAAHGIGARVVYLSSDYVFDGRGGGPGGGLPYTEWDTPNPQSHYGRSKLGGERELEAILGPDATIVRTSWVVGRYGQNFVKTMLRLAADSEVSPTVIDDQLGCPTFTADLAIVARQLAVMRVPGLFHVCNEGPVTWCDFARAIFEAAGADPERVRAVTSKEYAAGRPEVTAPRPSYSVLDRIALGGVGLQMPSWRPGLKTAVDALR
jgi:dTDP-4-dehydrorhamnose reductase